MISLVPLLLLPGCFGSASRGADEVEVRPALLALLERLDESPDPARSGIDVELAELSGPDIGHLVDLLAFPPAEAPADAVVLRGLGLVSRPLLLREIEGRFGPEGEQAEVVAGLRILEEHGSGAETRLCLAGGSALGPQVDDSEVRLFERTLRVLAERDPDACIDALLRSWNDLPELLVAPMVRVVSLTGRPRALELFQRVVDRHRHLDRLVLVRIPLVLPEDWPTPTEFDPAFARGRLVPTDPGLCRGAALAVGRLGDADAIPLLIALLEEPSDGIAKNALHALRQITRLEFAPSRQAWTTWYEAERLWWRRHAPSTFDALASRDAGEALGAVREVSAHRLDRHELAAELEVALEHDAAEVRARACEGIAAMRSRGSVDALRIALEDEEDRVVAAALAALIAVTGMQGTENPEDWADVAVPDRQGLR